MSYPVSNYERFLPLITPEIVSRTTDYLNTEFAKRAGVFGGLPVPQLDMEAISDVSDITEGRDETYILAVSRPGSLRTARYDHVYFSFAEREVLVVFGKCAAPGSPIWDNLDEFFGYALEDNPVWVLRGIKVNGLGLRSYGPSLDKKSLKTVEIDPLLQELGPARVVRRDFTVIEGGLKISN